MTVDKAEVQAMINASVMPITREQRRQRKRTDAMSKRLDDVEAKADEALKVGELVERVVTEGMARIELKMDKQHAEIVGRLNMAEGWIGRRRRLETAAVRFSQIAVVAALRRWLPFIVMLGGVLGMWWILVSLMEGGL
ncbi:MAG: hypothetical protein IPO91_34535 [Chloroflexi bacterium]|nr:hypothetical protein [Chloroflexota bacterium]MBK9751857.1 hypothetical protein [Chloroflexota bacterium]